MFMAGLCARSPCAYHPKACTCYTVTHPHMEHVVLTVRRRGLLVDWELVPAIDGVSCLSNLQIGPLELYHGP